MVWLAHKVLLSSLNLFLFKGALMSQGFVNSQNIPLPLPATLGGTGLSASGDNLNILVSDGTTFQSVTPLNATPNFGLTYIMVRGYY